MSKNRKRVLLAIAIIIMLTNWYMITKGSRDMNEAWKLANEYAETQKPYVKYFPYGERDNLLGTIYFFRPDVYSTETGLMIEAPLIGKLKLTLIKNNFEKIAQPRHKKKT